MGQSMLNKETKEIYKILHNIATNGANTNKSSEAEWEGCSVKFKSKEKSLAPAALSGLFGGVASPVFEMMAPKNDKDVLVSSLTMPDGAILYRAEGSKLSELNITHFRVGQWVERIKLYSEKVTLEYQEIIESAARNERIRVHEEQEKKLKPFSQIDF